MSSCSSSVVCKVCLQQLLSAFIITKRKELIDRLELVKMDEGGFRIVISAVQLSCKVNITSLTSESISSGY